MDYLVFYYLTIFVQQRLQVFFHLPSSFYCFRKSFCWHQKCLVSVVHNLSKSAKEFVSGSHMNIINQNISEDWNFVDEGLFVVSFSLLLAGTEKFKFLSQNFGRRFRSSLVRVTCLILFEVSPKWIIEATLPGLY